jgi:L-rhamnose mutarotase
MNLDPGQAAEYEKRHDETFPDLVDIVKAAGMCDYTVWHDPKNNHLFGILTRRDNHTIIGFPTQRL